MAFCRRADMRFGPNTCGRGSHEVAGAGCGMGWLNFSCSVLRADGCSLVRKPDEFHSPPRRLQHLVRSLPRARSNAPGHEGLREVKYAKAESGVLLEWKDLAPEVVKYRVRHGISVDPPFRKTEISDADLEALAKFLSRNSPK